MSIVNVMLCQTANEKTLKRIKYPCYVQEKCDGARIIIVVRDIRNHIVSDTIRTVELFTRQGKQYTQLPTLSAELEKLPVGVYDGELLFGNLDRKTSNGLARKAQSDGKITQAEADLARVVLWDYIELADYRNKFSIRPYKARLSDLRKFIEDIENPRIQLVWTQTVTTEVGIDTIFESMLSQGKEGVVIKNVNAPWKPHRSPNCLKMKDELTCELRAIEMVEGLGKDQGHMGSLHCVSDDGKIDVWVGSGSVAMREYWWSKGGFKTWDSKSQKTIVDIPEKPIVEIKFNEPIESKSRPGVYSLFLPIFVKERFDKTETDTLETILNMKRKSK